MPWEVRLWPDVESWTTGSINGSTVRRNEMSKTTTTSRREVQAKRPVNEAAGAKHAARMQAAERAYRLREIRQGQGVTQRELAKRMGLTQPTISALEAGDPDRSGVATLTSYVEALGGTVEVTATFGDRKLVLSPRAK
jgi:DNA-binding XRE family transcriptional regulator